MVGGKILVTDISIALMRKNTTPSTRKHNLRLQNGPSRLGWKDPFRSCCDTKGPKQRANTHDATGTMPPNQRPRYGQVVVGPCGSGKTTFCDGMQQYLKLLGRDPVVINLDPANEYSDDESAVVDGGGDNNGNQTSSNTALPYSAVYDVTQTAVNLSSVMSQLGLGPNGGLVYCMEYLESHADEIVAAIQERLSPTSYLIFDFPGQVELYTHSTCVQKLLQKMVKAMDLRLTVVQLIDALYCTDVTKFLSAAVLGTTTLLRLELPTVSVLSKVDLLHSNTYGELPLQLDFFTECHDLERLVPFLHQTAFSLSANAEQDKQSDLALDYADDPLYQRARRQRAGSKLAVKHERLHRALAEVVDDYGLLNFLTLDITSAESVGRVLAKIDKCNGYIFTEGNTNGTPGSVNQSLFECAVKASDDSLDRYEAIADIRERISSPDSIQELQK
jgi:GPN-loop GTPase